MTKKGNLCSYGAHSFVKEMCSDQIFMEMGIDQILMLIYIKVTVISAVTDE